MATTKEVQVVRWQQPSPLYGRRVLNVRDFEAMGIFTQENPLVFDKEHNYWIRLDETPLSDEARAYLEDEKNWHPGESFTFETQKVKVKPGEEDNADEAEAKTDGDPGVEGSGPTGSPSGTSTGNSTTTQSTAASTGRGKAR